MNTGLKSWLYFKPVIATLGGLYEVGLLMRDRRALAIVLFLIIALGLASRKYSGIFPHFLGKYPGDALWAAAVYFAFAFIFPRTTPVFLSVAATVFSLTIEFSQIYHSPMVDAVRNTTIGHLIFGTTFNPKDLLAYLVGIVLAASCDYLVWRLKHRRGRGA